MANTLLRRIFIYLYRLNGEAQYVGQAVNVEWRHKAHCKSLGIPFERFMKEVGADKFTIEVLGSCVDWPRGPKINALENHFMNVYETYFPDSGKGYNFGRAHGFSSVVKYEAMQAAQKAGALRNARNPRWLASLRARLRSPAYLATRQKMFADPAYQAKQKAGAQKLRLDPAWKVRHKAGMKKRSLNPEWRVKVSTIALNQEWRAKQKAGAERNARNPEWQLGQLVRAKKMMADPKWQEAQRAGLKVEMARRRLDPANLRSEKSRLQYARGFCTSKGCKRKHAPSMKLCRPCHKYWKAVYARAGKRKAA
jgi:hypothetical protein